MVEEHPSKFRFSADDQDPETFYHEELKDLRVEKLSQRIMLLSILLPILIGVAILFVYSDLTDRVSRSQNTGYDEVQRISRELEEISKKFNEKLITFSTTLSSQDKDFGTTVSGKLVAVNKNIAAVNKNVAALNKNVAALDKNFKSLDQNLHKTRSTLNNLAASKADKKSQQAAIAKINDGLKPLKKELKSLANLRRDVKGVSSEIKKLEGGLNRKLAKIAAAAEQSQKNYGQLQASIATLADDMIDRDTFDLEVFKIKKNYQNRLAQEIAAVNQKLETIQKKMDGIQESSTSLKKSMKSLSKKAPPAKATGTAKATTPAKSGSINEQDLPE
jgi:DNA repair exonuclease SbcCD ATPase subunit